VPFRFPGESDHHDRACRGVPVRLIMMIKEERLKGLRPEEVLRQFRPEELLSRLEPEEIEAYLLELKKQKRLQDADRQIEG